MIYMDNAATSWPKPPEVLRAMTEVLERAGGNPGRSGHRLSIEAARVIYDVREEVAQFFHAADPLRVVFTANVTHALNTALLGFLDSGDHVVVSSMEHNAVMRPLRYLEQQGVFLSIVPCAPDGSISLQDVAEAMTVKTRLVVIVHASNVIGTILPVAEIAAIAHSAGALILVDAAQTAGAIPIDVQAMGIDLLAFTGHKALQGPPGIGGLVIGAGVDVARLHPLMRGGTGSQSELEVQPEYMPDKYESGTPNIVGIAGLGAGIRWLKHRGVDAIRDHEKMLTNALIDGLSVIPGVKLYGIGDSGRSMPVVSIAVSGKRVSEVGQRLDDEFDILCRVGLHCAPSAHKTIGTFPEGTVRFAPGALTTLDEVQQTIKAVERITRS